jgi:hypothetical protein
MGYTYNSNLIRTPVPTSVIAMRCSDVTLVTGIDTILHGTAWNKLDVDHVGSIDLDTHDLLYGKSKGSSLKIVFPREGIYQICLKGSFSVERFNLNTITNGILDLERDIEISYYPHASRNDISLFEHMINNHYRKGDVLEFIVKSSKDLILHDCSLQVVKYKAL